MPGQLQISKQHYPKTKGLALASLFATLLGVTSIISIPIPFSPAPITLQVMMLFLIVSLLGPVFGTLSCTIYLFLGAIGIPVFAGLSSGIPILLGPTGGYLFGFPLAAFAGGMVSSRLSRNRKMDLIRVSTATCVSLIVVYGTGVLWLANYLHLALFQSILIGAFPFIFADIAKAIVAIPIIMSLRWQHYYLPVRVS